MEKVFFAGGNFKSTNRGVQALAYGGVEFIYKKIGNDTTVTMCYFAKKRKQDYEITNIDQENKIVYAKHYNYFDIIIAFFELRLHKLLKQKLFNKLSKDIKEVKYFFNINGGDSCSDIYGFKQYFIFILPSLFALSLNVKHVLLPQTFGPFKNTFIKFFSKEILKNSEVYIRDNEFVETLKDWNISYHEEVDVSFYMMPQKPEKKIDIKPNSIGINISGLAYYNRYGELSGHFDNYKPLIFEIIKFFQNTDKQIYLVPHTYGWGENSPRSSDDLTAIKAIYNELENKKAISIIDYELTAPELKYIISQFSFLIGTRMHACFAGIFTGVNTFGLAYSYKFKGSFKRFGLENNFHNINYLDKKDIPVALETMSIAYMQGKK